MYHLSGTLTFTHIVSKEIQELLISGKRKSDDGAKAPKKNNKSKLKVFLKKLL